MFGITAKIMLIVSAVLGIFLYSYQPSPVIVENVSPVSIAVLNPVGAGISTAGMAGLKTTTTPQKATSAVKKSPRTLSTTTASNTPNRPISPPTLIPIETLNEIVRPTIVNIFCTTRTNGDFNPISGSGVIIDPRGVILTNAHVAQYFLLKDYLMPNFISCIARNGNPARNAYSLSLLYLPDAWLTDNALMIKSSNPEGTGENDFALIMITGSLTESPLPSPFPFLDTDPNQNNITGDVPVLLSGYPSNFLGGIEIVRDLWIISSPAYLTKLYFFEDNKNYDAFSVGPNIVAQKGASGGAAVNDHSGKLQGILTTITEGHTTGDRDLSAISIAHIERSLKKETGRGIREFLDGDLTQKLSDFNKNRLPEMSKTLIGALNSTSTPAN